jgi:hypothetical protein
MQMRSGNQSKLLVSLLACLLSFTCQVCVDTHLRAEAKRPAVLDHVDEAAQEKARAKLKDTSEKARYRNGDDYVASAVVIEAPVSVVWDVVHSERDSAPNLVYSKLHKENEGLMVLEQKWTVVPFVKTTTCVIEEKEVKHERIDYRVLKSNQFKVMEGAWIFTPSPDGKSTTLKLTTHLELRGIGSGKIVNMVAKRKISQRLAHVKELAEKPHADLTVGGKVIRD